MRVFIAGMDGYLGWSLAKYLALGGHEVGGADAFLRRSWVAEMGSDSAIPILPMPGRLDAFAAREGVRPRFWELDLRDSAAVRDAIAAFRPDAVVHLGECPSAPYSMMDADHASFVQANNLQTTFNLLYAMRDAAPDAHLVKLGTMGEYGYGHVDAPIPEGFVEVTMQGRRARIPYPREAGSWYHWSKVHGSYNVSFACRLWGLRATDIMQGIVFGSRFRDEDGALATRFDFDEAFGTVLNRFCCQAAIGEPLTLYGVGHQKRGFLPLGDSMRCLELALTNPPQRGEYRVFNQFAEIYDLTGLAHEVKAAGDRVGLSVTIEHIDNPRAEREVHGYEAAHDNLIALGYEPSLDLRGEIDRTLADLLPHAARIRRHRDALYPRVTWRGGADDTQPSVEALAFEA